jgi:hypothetical protein
MKHSIDHFSPSGFVLPGIRQISMDRPLAWLKAGWHDLKANPLPSLAYGLLFAIGGDLIILALLETPHLLTVSISGFFLVAPLLAAGLYELSRRTRHRREDPVHRLAQMLRSQRPVAGLLRPDPGPGRADVGALLGGGFRPDRRRLRADCQPAYLNEILFDGQHLAFAAPGSSRRCAGAAGHLVAVVSVPLMLDRDADVATAIMTSLRTFALNAGPCCCGQPCSSR